MAKYNLSVQKFIFDARLFLKIYLRGQYYSRMLLTMVRIKYRSSIGLYSKDSSKHIMIS